MKILYFHQYFRTPEHDGGIRSFAMAMELIRRGHSVTMVCGGSPIFNLSETNKKKIHRGYLNNIDVIQIALPYSNKFGLLKRTKTFCIFALSGIKIALKEEYDILFASSTPLTIGIPGIIAKMFRKKTFVFEVRDLWPEIPKALGLKNPFVLAGMSFLEWLTYHMADACIGLSPRMVEGIKERSQKGKLIKMIPNGCDLEMYDPRKRQSLFLDGIKASDTVAIYSGSHGIVNGLDAILDASLYLKKLGREDIVICFFGDGKMKQHLVERAKNEKLTNCRFYDQVTKIELEKILASADIGLMTFLNVTALYYGTSPNKFFDYISSGLPVINNYPGWLADMIRDNQLGIVVPPDDSEAFANGLIELTDNRVYRKRAGLNARAFAEKNFSREHHAKEFVSFMEDVVHSST